MLMPGSSSPCASAVAETGETREEVGSELDSLRSGDGVRDGNLYPRNGTILEQTGAGDSQIVRAGVQKVRQRVSERVPVLVGGVALFGNPERV